MIKNHEIYQPCPTSLPTHKHPKLNLNPFCHTHTAHAWVKIGNFINFYIFAGLPTFISFKDIG